ncbi:hypothetical protein USDA257_c52890 [Sinorhizobium fredii USDA 257]|uniref:Uncharacterized protein n=1 Tax=Sinorhizobium fredii (strain USDA 257) TaxID=1185652 RepID=I3XD58_SINF2|nr:hypothetical protein USDA257_c52890 [Sinorhizobium fredii USDA 257]
MRRIDHKTGVGVNRLFEGFLTENSKASARRNCYGSRSVFCSLQAH